MKIRVELGLGHEALKERWHLRDVERKVEPRSYEMLKIAPKGTQVPVLDLLESQFSNDL